MRYIQFKVFLSKEDMPAFQFQLSLPNMFTVFSVKGKAKHSHTRSHVIFVNFQIFDQTVHAFYMFLKKRNIASIEK